MRRNNKKITTYILLCSIFLIGTVYAILQANLQVNGTAKIASNTWSVHFDNIEVNENSVSIGTEDQTAIIDPLNNCKVDFEVTLSTPGDFYEFTIDVVNEGSIDAMISSLNKTLKINNEVINEIPYYLKYEVTFSDGTEIEDNHIIPAQETEIFKVRLEFKRDISTVPSATVISTSLALLYLQSDGTSNITTGPLYNVFKTEAQSGSYVQQYSGAHRDSVSHVGNTPIYYWRAESDLDANTILDRWNVIFGNFCWQMYRTTDTGGVKLLYNGIPNNGKCNNTGANQQTGTSKINEENNSPAFTGYMLPAAEKIKETIYEPVSRSVKYGNGIIYENGTYTLTNYKNNYDNTHHYSCNSTGITCSTVRYYFTSFLNYVELDGEESIDEILENLLYANDVNKTPSIIKNYIETWYQNHMTNYTNKIEDVIYCNDRSIIHRNGWDPTEENHNTTYLELKNYTLNTDLNCANITDRFSVSNNKAKSHYPVGFVTSSELYILNNNILRQTGEKYWTGSPYYYGHSSAADMRYVDELGELSNINVIRELGIRPVVSLKPGTNYASGTGSKNTPYIIN